MRRTGSTKATSLVLLLATLMCCLGALFVVVDSPGLNEVSSPGHSKTVRVHQSGLSNSHQRFQKVGNGGGFDRASFSSVSLAFISGPQAAFSLTPVATSPQQPLKRWLLFCVLLI